MAKKDAELLPDVALLGDQLRCDLIIEEGDPQAAAKNVAEIILYAALQAVEATITDRRELYTADEAIDAIRTFAIRCGLEVA